MGLTSRSRAAATLLALTLSMAGCASSGASGGGSSRGSSTRIVEDELATVQQLNLYDAIGRLRPAWFQTHSGADPQVMVDGTRRAGGIQELLSIRAIDVAEVRYLSASDATTRYGTGFMGGAILVTTKN